MIVKDSFCDTKVLFYTFGLFQVCHASPWLHYHEPTECREPGGADQQRPGVSAAGSLPAL